MQEKSELFDKDDKLLGILEFEQNHAYTDWYEGIITFINFPQELLDLLVEHRNLAEQQIFSLLDDVEDKIEDFGLKIHPEAIRIYSFQLVNENNEIRFKKLSRY